MCTFTFICAINRCVWQLKADVGSIFSKGRAGTEDVKYCLDPLTDDTGESLKRV